MIIMTMTVMTRTTTKIIIVVVVVVVVVVMMMTTLTMIDVAEVLLHVHRNRRFIRNGEPRTSTSTFTQLLSSDDRGR